MKKGADSPDRRCARFDEFFSFNRDLMMKGWVMDAYRFTMSRSYPCFDGSATITAKARVG